MEIIISNSSDVPIYIQVKEQIKNKIISNELKTGEILPSIRNLAKDLRISVITVKSAYEELARENFIQSISTKGYIIAGKNTEIIREEQLSKIQSLVQNAVDVAKISKISKEEIHEMVNILFEEE